MSASEVRLLTQAVEVIRKNPRYQEFALERGRCVMITHFKWRTTVRIQGAGYGHTVTIPDDREIAPLVSKLLRFTDEHLARVAETGGKE